MFYIDVDAVCKLAHWKILPHLPRLLECSWDQIATVTSLRFRALRCIDAPDGKLFHSSTAARAVLDSLAQMGSIPTPNANILETLNAIPQVDPGEAVLIGATLSDPKNLFITGDKRALRALAQHPLSSSLANRIVLIEQILKICHARDGRSWLLASIHEYQKIDKAISMIVGTKCDASEESLREGLSSYINEIKNLCDPSMIANDFFV